MLLSGVLFVLFLAGCWIYCLTDAALTPAAEFRGLKKNTWIYIIAATFIVGAIAWLIARGSWRAKRWAPANGGRGWLAGPTAGLTWDSAWTAADEAAARHPAGRSRQAPGNGKLPKGPDDDLEFLRQLDHRIRGTSADPGELSPPRGAAGNLSIAQSTLIAGTGCGIGRARVGARRLRLMIVGSSQRISRKCPHDHGLASRVMGLAAAPLRLQVVRRLDGETARVGIDTNR